MLSTTFSLGEKVFLVFLPGRESLSRTCLDRDSQSQHCQKVSLDSQENLNTFKIFVSTVKISRWRSRFLYLVSTSMSRPKSLDQDKLFHPLFARLLKRSQLLSAWEGRFDHLDELPDGRMKCTLCGKDFASRMSAVNHTNNIHLFTEAIECSICNRVFKNKLNFRTHILRTHHIRGKDIVQTYGKVKA